eukprot:TRINITY_DN13080_c0_g1_i5.p1 TRINITY_DN13080_c0_g1~~TRINITY_DN13080_c0_g1_i5.p1  ORF type:complete len:128 (+),score=5.14 TRINITY_DN13080_c0_g1_i5:290-673(+)
MGTRGNQTCSGNTRTLGYIIFAVMIGELIFSSLRIVSFLCYFQLYLKVSLYLYISYTVFALLLPVESRRCCGCYRRCFSSRRPMTALTVRARQRVEWKALNSLILSWIIYLYAIVMLSLITICVSCF